MTKPFDELMLRAQALLRRAKSVAAKPSTRLAAGALLLDIEWRGLPRHRLRLLSIQGDAEDRAS